MGKLWSYSTGKRGENKVRVYERYKGSRLYIEWYADGQRWQRSLKIFTGRPVTHKGDAIAIAHQLAEQITEDGIASITDMMLDPHVRDGMNRAVQDRLTLPEDELFAHELPADPMCGIYFLLDSDDRVLYVGQSRDILARLTAHRRAREIAFARCVYQPFEQEELERAEGFYIHRFKPPHNVKIPFVRVDDEKLTWGEP